MGGIFGNIYHRDTALKMLNETLKMSEPERLEYLKSKGGTNVFAPVVAIIIQSLIIAALILPLCGRSELIENKHNVKCAISD